MSYANSPAKVLRTALKRLQKRWGKGAWVGNKETGYKVCIEGAICNANPGTSHRRNTTEPQRQALLYVEGVLRDGGKWTYIPAFNDAEETTFEDVEKVIKAAIIRAETGAPLPDHRDEPF